MLAMHLEKFLENLLVGLIQVNCVVTIVLFAADLVKPGTKTESEPKRRKIKIEM
jgi:hypothetical protein